MTIRGRLQTATVSMGPRALSRVPVGTTAGEVDEIAATQQRALNTSEALDSRDDP